MIWLSQPHGGSDTISAVAQETPHLPAKLRVDVDDGPIATVRIRGIMDKGFDGKRLAASFTAKKVIIDLKGARRISSSAVPKWTDFITAVCARPDADVYLIEVLPHVLSQFNMLVGLQGKAKIVSFYAPYRCHTCSKEFEVLMVLPRDRPIVRDATPPENPCPSCGGRSDMDDDPQSFFAAVAKQAYFDVDHEIAAYLRTRLKYQLTPDATRLRVERFGASKMSYTRISGNVDRSFPAEAVSKSLTGEAIVDLAGAKLVDQGGVIQWRTLIRTAQPLVSRITLVQCPPGFLERALVPEDVDERLQVLSFQVEYECSSCMLRTTRTIDAEESHAGLRSAHFPETPCETCRVPMMPLPSEDLLALLRIMQKPSAPQALRRFANKGAKRPANRLTDVLLARPARSIPPALIRAVYVIAALVVIILGVQAIIAYRLQNQQRQVVQAPTAAPAAPTADIVNVVRPAWIISDTPASSYCHDLINHFMCVGVSSFQGSRDDAVIEANDAALEELSNAVGIKIADEVFKRKVLPMYQEPRQRTLGALATTVDRGTSAEYAKLVTLARDARKRAAEALRASGGTAVPAQRSDWFWEEYAVEKGTGSDFLVFVRYDISLDSIKALVEKYSVQVEVMESSAVTVFPGLAWKIPQVKSGAMIVKAGGALSKAGLKEQSIVTAVGEQAIADAAQLADRLKGAVKASVTAIVTPDEAAQPKKIELP